MLKVRGLTKKFYQNSTEVPVVDNLSFEVKPGEVYGFLGPNGAGKTTTVKMIVGLLFPDQGTIQVSKYPAGSLAAQEVLGFMPEQPQFYRHLRASEVLEFVGELFQLNEDTVRQRSKHLLNQVGLEQATNLPVKDFSKGMHQRLAFAVALMNNPQLLILDEPLDGLDPLGRLDFKRLIKEWKKEGKTIFFSSHILSDAQELCDRVAIIAQGEILSEGKPSSLTKGKKSLEEFFVEKVRENA